MISIRQGALSYPEREAKKQDAYDAHDAGQISDLMFFEEITEAWWYRQGSTIGLHEYRRHVIRAKQLGGETPAGEILKKYPPAVGNLKIAPGGSDYYPTGLPRSLTGSANRTRHG